MRKVNINNKEEVRLFKAEISDYLWIDESTIIPYRREDSTNKGANYRIFVPLKCKNKLSSPRLHAALRNEVDADKITIEYVEFVKE